MQIWAVQAKSRRARQWTACYAPVLRARRLLPDGCAGSARHLLQLQWPDFGSGLRILRPRLNFLSASL